MIDVLAHLRISTHKKRLLVSSLLIVDLEKLYLFFHIEYKTQSATRPTNPCEPICPRIDVTFVITLVAGINGIEPAPLNSISNTIVVNAFAAGQQEKNYINRFIDKQFLFCSKWSACFIAKSHRNGKNQ